MASVSEALFESACPTLSPNARFTWDIGAPGVLVNPPYGTTQCTNAYRARWGLPLTDDVFVAECAGPTLSHAHRIMIGADVYWTRGPDSVRYWTTD